MNRESKKYLFDVLVACNEISSFVSGSLFDDYLDNPLLRRAVERDMEIIGEALAQLRAIDPQIFAAIPDSPRIVAIRHRLIHTYAEVDDEIVWDAANHDVPRLGMVVSDLLETYPE